MAEKELKGRFQLRYDTYANWTSTTLGDGKGANFVLKAGEVGICSIPAGTNANGIQNPPHVMFKVGDGTSAFSALSWTSAKAADVYAWAKQASLPVVDTDEGNVITNVTWENNGLKISRANVATSEQINNLTGRVEAIENGYATDSDLSAAVEAINAAIALKADKTYVDTELGKKVNVSDFNTFKTENTAAIGTAKSEAVAAAKTETTTQVNALKNGEVKANADAITAIKDGATIDSFADVESALAGKQAAGDYATKAEAQGYANAKDAAIQAAQKAGDEAQTYAEGVAGDLAEEIERAKGAEAAALKAAQDAQADIDAFMAAAETGDAALDTLKEIQDFLNSDEGTVQVLIDDVAANKEDIADILDGTKTVANATNAVNATKAADADKLGGAAAADYLKKADAPGYGDILTKTAAAAAYQPKGEYASAEQGAKADTAVQPAALNNYYTKSAADAAFMDANETDDAIDAKITALKLGETYEPIGAETRAKAYADSLAGNYATAAQGAKADSALQSVAAGTGLKVSAKANNSQTIEIDEDVIFVFNGGTASTVL